MDKYLDDIEAELSSMGKLKLSGLLAQEREKAREPLEKQVAAQDRQLEALRAELKELKTGKKGSRQTWERHFDPESPEWNLSKIAECSRLFPELAEDLRGAHPDWMRPKVVK